MELLIKHVRDEVVFGLAMDLRQLMPTFLSRGPGTSRERGAASSFPGRSEGKGFFKNFYRKGNYTVLEFHVADKIDESWAGSDSTARDSTSATAVGRYVNGTYDWYIMSGPVHWNMNRGAKQPGTCNKEKIRDGTNEKTAAAAAAASSAAAAAVATEQAGARTKEVHENYGFFFAKEASGARCCNNYGTTNDENRVDILGGDKRSTGNNRSSNKQVLIGGKKTPAATTGAATTIESILLATDRASATTGTAANTNELLATNKVPATTKSSRVMRTPQSLLTGEDTAAQPFGRSSSGEIGTAGVLVALLGWAAPHGSRQFGILLSDDPNHQEVSEKLIELTMERLRNPYIRRKKRGKATNKRFVGDPGERAPASRAGKLLLLPKPPIYLRREQITRHLQDVIGLCKCYGDFQKFLSENKRLLSELYLLDMTLGKVIRTHDLKGTAYRTTAAWRGPRPSKRIRGDSSASGAFIIAYPRTRSVLWRRVYLPFSRILLGSIASVSERSLMLPHGKKLMVDPLPLVECLKTLGGAIKSDEACHDNVGSNSSFHLQVDAFFVLLISRIPARLSGRLSHL
eukprot:Gb_23640 [translate_table: standard]